MVRNLTLRYVTDIIGTSKGMLTASCYVMLQLTAQADDTLVLAAYVTICYVLSLALMGYQCNNM